MNSRSNRQLPASIRAVLLDSGDTLVDEGSEVRDRNGVVLKAELLPGAADLVRELHRRGFRLGLVADGLDASFRNVLGQHGIYDLFAVHATSERVGVEKPDPAIFVYALDRLGIPPADYPTVLMVGNNLERDILGANRVGLASVFIDWSPRRPKVPADDAERPKYTIHLPLELLDLINRIEKEALRTR